MDSYTLNYKLIDSTEKQSFAFRDKVELISFIKNLHRWIATIDGNIIKWMDDFSFFQIWLLNYDIDLGRGRYADFENWDSEPTIVSDIPWFRPRDEDVTNEILDECRFSSEENNMALEWEYLRVYGEPFHIKQESKLKDLLEILFSTEEKFMSYDEMKEIYTNWEYSEILEKDFYNEWVRWLMKYKQNEIKNRLNLKEKAFSVTIRWVTKNI